MGVKCIAIGNRLMTDDSIGIRVLEKLLPELKKRNVEAIFGETDIDYAFGRIDDGDMLYILDSTYFGIAPGEVTITAIENAVRQQGQINTQHRYSLIHMLTVCRKPVKGYIIGIEAEKTGFGTELSETLENRFLNICEKVGRLIPLTMIFRSIEF